MYITTTNTNLRENTKRRKYNVSKTMKTCYGYIRVSTDDQTKGYSPKNQIRQLKEYARDNGYNLIKIFDDSGKSGRTTDKRTELQELLTSVNTQSVDAILIYKIDRFARNLHDFTGIYNDLKLKGMKLLSVRGAT